MHLDYYVNDVRTTRFKICKLNIANKLNIKDQQNVRNFNNTH